MVLPALSVAVPVALWLVPLALRVTGLVTEAIPESASVALKVTVTGVLFQPFALATGKLAIPKEQVWVYI